MSRPSAQRQFLPEQDHQSWDEEMLLRGLKEDGHRHQAGDPGSSSDDENCAGAERSQMDAGMPEWALRASGGDDGGRQYRSGLDGGGYHTHQDASESPRYGEMDADDAQRVYSGQFFADDEGHGLDMAGFRDRMSASRPAAADYPGYSRRQFERWDGEHHGDGHGFGSIEFPHGRRGMVHRMDTDGPQFCLRLKLLTLQHRVQPFMRVHDELMELPLLREQEHEASADDPHASPRNEMQGRWKSLEGFMETHYQCFEELMQYMSDEGLEPARGVAVHLLGLLKQLMDAQMYAVFTIRKRVHQQSLHRTANMQPAEASLMAATYCIKTHRQLLMWTPQLSELWSADLTDETEEEAVQNARNTREAVATSLTKGLEQARILAYELILYTCKY